VIFFIYEVKSLCIAIAKEIFLAEEYGKPACRRHEGSIYMQHYGVYLVF
jgi:hypothetical protein